VTEGAEPSVLAACHIFCETVSDWEAALAPHVERLMGDIANFTNVAPLMRYSTVHLDELAFNK
jgi:uncharacterized protein (TIGR02118 family)